MNEDSAHRCAHAAVPAALAAIITAVGLVSGCVEVTSTTKVLDEPIREYTKRDRRAGPKYFVEDSAKMAEDHGAISVLARVTKGHLCDDKQHRVVDRTELTERTYAHDVSSAALYLLGGITAAGGGGLVAYGAVDSKDWAIGLGAALVGAGLIDLVVVVANDVRVMDSSEHLGEVDEVVSTDVKPCDAEPAANVRVSLRGAGRTLGNAVTDATGRATIEVKAKDAPAKADSVAVCVNDECLRETQVLDPLVLAVEREAAEGKKRESERLYAAAVAKEIETGRCAPFRYDKTQEFLQHMRLILTEENFTLMGHDTVVATPEGTDVEHSGWHARELHIIALGFDPVSLVVRDRRGYEVKVRSQWELPVGTWSGGEVDGRIVQADVGDEIDIKVKGKGCTLVFALRKW